MSDKCGYCNKDLSLLNAENGAVVAQWVGSWFNLKTLWAKGLWFKSPSGHLIQSKFSVKRKNSMIYALTTTVLHTQPSDTY
jgi:hypothetical protein